MRLDKLRSSYLPASISLTHTCVGLHVAKLGFRTVEIDPVGRVTSAKGGAAVAVTLPTWPPARWADGSNHSKSAGRGVRRAGTGRGRPPRRRRPENVAPCVPPHAIDVGGALLRSCQVEQVSEDGLGKQNVLRESEEKTTETSSWSSWEPRAVCRVTWIYTTLSPTRGKEPLDKFKVSAAASAQRRCSRVLVSLFGVR